MPWSAKPVCQLDAEPYERPVLSQAGSDPGEARHLEFDESGLHAATKSP
jgi:hypothetical protein